MLQKRFLSYISRGEIISYLGGEESQEVSESNDSKYIVECHLPTPRRWMPRAMSFVAIYIVRIPNQLLGGAQQSEVGIHVVVVFAILRIYILKAC